MSDGGQLLGRYVKPFSFLIIEAIRRDCGMEVLVTVMNA